jgi:hypothetical protein
MQAINSDLFVKENSNETRRDGRESGYGVVMEKEDGKHRGTRRRLK